MTQNRPYHENPVWTNFAILLTSYGSY